VQSGLAKFYPADELARMRSAVEKALQLDPLSAEVHDARGLAYARDAQWQQAEASFRRAIELDPGRSVSYQGFATEFLLPLGRAAEALEQMRAAERIDPLSPDVQFGMATVLMTMGRYGEAAEHCEKVPESYSLKYAWLGRARLGQGRIDEAIELLTKDGHRGYLGYGYARAGRREQAEQMAANVSPIMQAEIFAGLGDKERTLQALDRGAALGPVHIGRLLEYPEFALLRGDPRLKALRKKLALPE
jgi:tetratricopeptide (TPR) repeat protein